MTGPGAPSCATPPRPTSAPVQTRLDEWWGGRKMRARLPRLWFRHFSGTSWIAETPDGRIAGFLVAFVSPDRADVAQSTSSASTRIAGGEGIGRALYEHAIDTLRGRGRQRRSRRSRTPTTGSPSRSTGRSGSRPTTAPGRQPSTARPRFVDYDGEGEDRVRLTRRLVERRPATRVFSRRDAPASAARGATARTAPTRSRGRGVEPASEHRLALGVDEDVRPPQRVLDELEPLGGQSGA